VVQLIDRNVAVGRSINKGGDWTNVLILIQFLVEKFWMFWLAHHLSNELLCCVRFACLSNHLFLEAPLAFGLIVVDAITASP